MCCLLRWPEPSNRAKRIWLPEQSQATGLGQPDVRGRPRKATIAGRRGGLPKWEIFRLGQNRPSSSDDDLTWLWPTYFKSQGSYLCPSTRNLIRTNMTAKWNGETLRDLCNNGARAGRASHQL
jgi:hypothetical protein